MKYLLLILGFLVIVGCSSNADDMMSSEEQEMENDDPGDGNGNAGGGDIDFISEFEVFGKKVQYNDVYIGWEKPEYNDSLEVGYSLYIDNNLVVSNLSETTRAHVLGCENFEVNQTHTIKVEAKDQYDHITFQEFEVVNKVPQVYLESLPDGELWSLQFIKLKSGGYLYYQMLDGTPYEGYQSMKLSFYDQNFNFSNEITLAPPSGFDRLGGFALPPGVEYPAHYLSCDVGDGIVFNSFVSNSVINWETSPKIFKINYNGDYIWSHTRNEQTDHQFEGNLGYNEITGNIYINSVSINSENPNVDSDIKFVKLNSNGDYISRSILPISHSWTQTKDNKIGVKFIGDGWVICYRNYPLSDTDYTAFVSKISLAGNVVWTQSFDAIPYEGVFPETAASADYTTGLHLNFFDDELSVAGLQTQIFYDEAYQNEVPQSQGYFRMANPFYAELNPNTGQLVDYKQFLSQEEWKYYMHYYDTSIMSSPLNDDFFRAPLGGIRFDDSYSVKKINDGYIFTNNNSSNTQLPCDEKIIPGIVYGYILKTDLEGKVLWRKFLRRYVGTNAIFNSTSGQKGFYSFGTIDNTSGNFTLELIDLYQ